MIICVTVLLLCAFAAIAFWRGYNSLNTIADYSDKLVITNLDVGKADCAFIEYNDYCGIIDTGTKDSYETISSFLENSGKKAIDFMLLTHYDKDHVGSAAKLLKNYDVKEIYLPDYVSSKSGYNKIMDAISGKDNVTFVSEIVNLDLDKLTIQIIPPNNSKALISDLDNMDNNMSLLCMITFGEKKFLFTGDIEEARIAQVLESGDDLSADWIKLPHHGRYKENLEELLALVSPGFAIISTGSERPLEDQVKSLLNKAGITYYSTENGSVQTICNGSEITIIQMGTRLFKH
ncbi:ComEC/Rec2 family competence protein [Butyrivibrio sp. VCB2006]|uniref:ComEC/Rec2 family competence protein n=1 Tax=Butyrivibrio sp. VCB2006 TaxID=1280679 RepID=UPI0004926D6D|nr:MBL fold metallo-hydrolase [Butyrivibrio sp. VCB2006]